MIRFGPRIAGLHDVALVWPGLGLASPPSLSASPSSDPVLAPYPPDAIFGTPSRRLRASIFSASTSSAGMCLAGSFGAGRSAIFVALVGTILGFLLWLSARPRLGLSARLDRRVDRRSIDLRLRSPG